MNRAEGIDVASLGTRLGQFAHAQLLAAEAHLASEGEARHKGVHEARKCLRRTRAILALGGRALGSSTKRLDSEIGRLCRGLSPLRDAQALVEAIGRLDVKELEAPALLARAVKSALESRDNSLTTALARDVDFAARRERLQRAAARLATLDWSTITRADVQHAFARSKRRMKKAARQAKRCQLNDEAWHRFRRRLRRLRQQNNVLAEIEPQLAHGVDAWKEQAIALGQSQDDALLLARCGKRSPFSVTLRAQLRVLAKRKLDQTRQYHSLTSKIKPTHSSHK